MSKSIFLGIFHFIVIALIQILILNGLQLFGYINPLLYIWFILLLPISSPAWLVLLSCFTMGFAVDIFEGQMGFHAAVTVFMGFIRPLFIKVFFENKDSDLDTRVTIAEMGITRFLPFAFIFVFVHHFLYFTFEIFSLKEFFFTLLRIILSTIATTLLIVVMDLMFIKSKK